MSRFFGWGAEPWGGGPWGGATVTSFSIVSAIAVAENVVRVQMTLPIYWSGLFDEHDAASPSKYTIATVGGIGFDGLPVHPVNVVGAVLTDSEDLQPNEVGNTSLDITTDRPLSPAPTSYSITLEGLFTADMSQPIDPAGAFSQFEGLYRVVVPPRIDAGHPMRDFGNQQTSSTQIVSPQPANQILRLGVFVPGSDGDYAIDQGLASLRKRIYRRLVTRPGGFAHLGPSYGVGIPSYGKRLALPSVIAKLSALAEKQIAQEPEVAQVKVTGRMDPSGTGLAWFTILVRTKTGQATKFSFPFSTTSTQVAA